MQTQQTHKRPAAHGLPSQEVLGVAAEPKGVPHVAEHKQLRLLLVSWLTHGRPQERKWAGWGELEKVIPLNLPISVQPHSQRSINQVGADT